MSLHHFIHSGSVYIKLKKMQCKTHLLCLRYSNIYHQSLTRLFKVNTANKLHLNNLYPMLCSYLIYFSPSYHVNGTRWYMLASSHYMSGFVHVCFMSAFYAFQALCVTVCDHLLFQYSPLKSSARRI